jgi:hypothetical protein
MRHSNLKKIETLSPLEVYTCRVDLADFKKRLIDIIDLEGDKQEKSTNIKADMTNWRLSHIYDEYIIVDEIFSDIYREIIETYKPQLYEILTYYHGNKFRFSHVDVWGAKYRSREKTIPHTHFPAAFSMCLYLKTPKGCPGLSFNDISKTIPVEENQMILFDSSVKHSVKSKKFRGYRYVIAGNIHTRFEDS